MVKLSTVAQRLNRTEYGFKEENFQELFEDAKKAGIVIVFGASDDLIEFRGAIYDEAGVYEGGTILIDEKGVVPVYESGEFYDEACNINQAKHLIERFNRATSVQAIWDSSGVSWQYKLQDNREFESFNIMEDREIYCEDQEIYCIGIVFYLTKDKES